VPSPYDLTSVDIDGLARLIPRLHGCGIMAEWGGAGSIEAKDSVLRTSRSCKRRSVAVPRVSMLVVSVMLCLLPGLGGQVPSAVAQDSWVFTESIPCGTAPVYGVSFNNCAVSNMRSFRVGNARAWRLLFSDASSEAAIGLYRLVEPKGVGGMGPATSSMGDWLRNADSLRSVTAGAFGWTQNDQYVAFQRPSRHCVGFMRTGPPPGGTVYWILGGAFCRASPTPIPPTEAQFLVNSVKVRD